MAPRNVHTLGSGSSRGPSGGSSSASNPGLKKVWDSIPPVTRAITIILCLNTSVCLLHLVSYSYIMFQWKKTFLYLQLWRLATSSMILPPKAMEALLELYNLFTRSAQLEREHFFITSKANPSIDYAFYLFFCLVTLGNVVALTAGPTAYTTMTGGFTSCLVFTWAVDNANTQVLFYGIIPVYGKYYPIISLLMAFVFGGFYVSLIGMGVAYLFLCLDTRSFGPIYGFIKGNAPSYGRAPGGKFCAPHWFIYLYETIFRVDQRSRFAKTIIEKPPVSSGNMLSGFKGTGSKLGGDSASNNRMAGQRVTNRERAKREKESSSVSTESETSTATGNFRGSGQRLGGKEE
ncbi:hypothetical protein C6P45_005239 [Maudiozyma exigua]|uniref:Derlin n=1 Tax=Maudiozyma exigua TaxID=34358 RepID=A0A9P6W9F7_MAUEX|nr:hypothetical protein C6P45_005239 [Kazachstania exigua]